MEFKTKVDGEQVVKSVKKNMDQLGHVVREAMQETAEEVADNILFEGAEDIQDAGNFGDRWVDALKAEISETQRTVTIDVSYEPDGPPVTYWKVFEYGATIRAKNRSGKLWIPFDDNNEVWPRDYPGELYRRKNVLFDEDTDQPMYLGVPEVTIPQKFHLHDIIKEEAEKAREVFKRILSEKRKE